VEDQGRGIAAEKLERIFDRFQQGDASDSRSLGGTGLGLALCRSIVAQHGGRIWAESTEGEGSRFLLTLPAAIDPRS
jgi:signal transduction histidine kinase